MKSPIIIIGIGELAGVFARGFLRNGHPVYPMTRQMDMATEAINLPEPELVLVAVQESELHAVLEKIPAIWQDKICLVQNELLPRDWQIHGLENPTVTVVWFEKKKQIEVTNILYSPSFGPHAHALSMALKAVEIPAPVLQKEEDLLYELVRKSIYILTVNIAGLVENYQVIELWEKHQQLAEQIAQEVIAVQETLVGEKLDYDKMIQGMVEGIKDCPNRHCLGRRALSRLERTLENASKANLATPKLQQIYDASKVI